MIIYISKKDNTTLIKLLEFNEKFKTYTVEFLNGDKKGKRLSYCSSTIKRWWKKCDEANDSFKIYNEVISDITQEFKEPFKFDRAKILSEIENALGMNFIPYKSTPGLYKTDSKPALFHLGITRKHITLYCKGALSKKIKYSDSYIDDIIKALN